MVDAHVHLEKGNYDIEWVKEFINYALERNIDEIYFLEHTHIFKECENLYYEISHYNAYQSQWYEKKAEKARPLKDYIDLIESMKKETVPVKLKFGLEVCYSPEHEKDIEVIKAMYPFDFLVGSIHFIDGWAFSHSKQKWHKEDYNMPGLYKRYYQLMCQLIDSNLFSGLAHPNSLQCFGAYPEGDYSADYDKIAGKLRKNHMYIEESSGLAINYGDPDLGMNIEMLNCMLCRNVKVLTASDAHVPCNVGKLVREMNGLIEKARLRIHGA